MPFVLTSNYKSDTLCRFGMAAGGQVGWWKLGDPGVAGRTLLHRFQRLDFSLLHQAVELASFHAESVLAVTRFLSGDVPIGHPAELSAFAGFKNDQKRIEGHLFLAFAEPRFQLIGQKSGDDSVVGIAGAQLKIEGDVKLAVAAAGWARFRYGAGEVVQRIEQFLMSSGLFMTVGAAEELRRHRWTCLSWKLAESGDWRWDIPASA